MSFIELVSEVGVLLHIYFMAAAKQFSGEALCVQNAYLPCDYGDKITERHTL